MTRKNYRLRVLMVALPFCIAALLTFLLLPSRSATVTKFDPNKLGAPNVDVNATAAAVRKATSAQTAALNQFKANYVNASVRWNSFAGSPDVMMGFHTPASNDTPENAARTFVAANSALFGVDPASLTLVDQKPAMGGYLVKFQQQIGGLSVLNGGLGFVMSADKEIRMVMGSTFRDANVALAPSLSADAAIAGAQAGLAKYAVSRPPGTDQYTTKALAALQQEIAPVLRAPRLNIFPTADGYKLAWNVMTFSQNPFGLYITQVDANSGQILARENKVHTQAASLPYTADIYPNHPVMANPDTGELKLNANGEPEGLLRVTLRNYNEGTNATGVAGTMTGPHALIKNVLAVAQPFAQAAQGTWHFRQNNAPLEAQPNEADDLAEPAEHIDDANIFFFVNYLLEYMTDIHRRDDAVHSRIGQGDFPDDFPNSDRPLVALPHFPSQGPEDASTADAIVQSTLGYDNAFSLPVTETVDTPAGPQKIIVNPTVYGHGYLFNDLGKDGAVVYHEGTHSISTPIAGLEGAEGSPLNEAQADLWAYTITDAEAIGEYVVQGARVRDWVRNCQIFAADTNCDVNRLAFIRSVHTSLKYSYLGTEGGNGFEEHRDGEIYVGAMWDLRNLMKAAEPQMSYLRPSFLDGQPTRQISQGQESWERLHLGSIYLLGLTAPDTFVKFRDAVIEADRILYSTDPSNLDAPGQHEALIWQVFASHEMGVNADTLVGGRQTISTRVTQFAAEQNHAGANQDGGGVPQGVTVAPASTNSLRVSWQPVSGALAYEVFKRKVGTAGQRQFAGATLHTYFDGDMATNGWSHLAYVLDPTTNYEDKGFTAEFFGPAGLSSASANGYNEMLDTEYAVRAISINSTRQAGVSDLSGGTTVNSQLQDVTSAIAMSIANPTISGGVFEIDATLKNNGISSPDGTAYGPITYRIVSISDPTVKVINADNGGDGQSNPAAFVYNQTLPAGATSNARHIKFSDPGSRMFTVTATITARVRTAPVGMNGSQPGDGAGTGLPPTDVRFSSQTETLSGIVVAGSAGNVIISGVDYVDIPFVAKPNSFGVDGAMDTFPVSAGALPDLDLQLLDDQDHVLSSSGNLGPKEFVSGAMTAGKTYRYRVTGFVNGPTQVNITSKQYFPAGMAPSSSGGSATSPLPTVPGVTPLRTMQLSFNPLTRTVSLKK
ncbi:MAG TPA: M36 family metallopeptidase [Pyrinomonadaceae bacterium]|nr:M36 family metallopeptidase [Pyrinomonadaceae bacterium]